ncbi:secreted RxLR effector protein 78-like [Solenopsis invicta]|uniref:secreted RxLR effector protein 78-like n=1 Tax=Solenopsis invicta TaxID=13686 RepID=UPI00193E9A3C|nr:secreted RxLR effector protein 78-like [Solenopsis invicta]
MAYKVYAAVLAERLKEEVERKGILPPSQTGFRRGVGTIDLIYMINKRVAVRKGKMVVLYIDLKAAFDSVDREILIQMMRERGVKESLVVRCEEVLEETLSRVRVGKKVGENFWTGKGVRQRCPLSPCLFTLLLADLDEELERE